MTLSGLLFAIPESIVIKSPVSLPAYYLLSLPSLTLLLLSLLSISDEVNIFQPYSLPQIIYVPLLTYPEDCILPVIFIESPSTSEVLTEPLDLSLYIDPSTLLDSQSSVELINILSHGVIDWDGLSQYKIQMKPSPRVDYISGLSELLPICTLPVLLESVEKYT